MEWYLQLSFNYSFSWASQYMGAPFTVGWWKASILNIPEIFVSFVTRVYRVIKRIDPAVPEKNASCKISKLIGDDGAQFLSARPAPMLRWISRQPVAGKWGRGPVFVKFSKCKKHLKWCQSASSLRGVPSLRATLRRYDRHLCNFSWKNLQN